METSNKLRNKACRYRRLRENVTDEQVRNAIVALADEYDALAAKLESETSEVDGDQS